MPVKTKGNGLGIQSLTLLFEPCALSAMQMENGGTEQGDTLRSSGEG